MSTKKRPLEEVLQSSYTPNPRNPATPFDIYSRRNVVNKRPRSAQSAQRSIAVRPDSARAILRRLAKLTAPITKKRVVTPTSIPRQKENLPPQESDDDDEDLKRPKFALDVEDSIEEDSGLLIPPTPSALLEVTDDEDDAPPTITFLRDQEQREDLRASHKHPTLEFSPHDDDDLQGSPVEEDDGGNSTFLTERGRRAISEEPTRMSRYSFGSIRMSDFGSELEIRRVSERQNKLAQLEAQNKDSYEGFDENDIVHFGGETEDLRNLQGSPSVESVRMEETFQTPAVGHDSFYLEFQDGPDMTEHEHALANQDIASGKTLLLADSMVGEDEADNHDLEALADEAATTSMKQTRRQTLLESVVAASKPRSRKKMKLNRHGNMVPALPSSLIRSIVNDSQEKAGKRKITLGKDHMKALEQATEWFFEQASEDLAMFASHGKRKKRIIPSDVLLLMRRQRVLRNHGDLSKLAKEWLPRDMLTDLDLPERP